jgi:hypothetical protein
MKLSQFRSLIREEVRKVLNENDEQTFKSRIDGSTIEYKTTNPLEIRGWVHAWNPKTKKYKMFPNATVALQKGFIYAIAEDDVEFVEPEVMEDWDDQEALENDWVILSK